jgi:chromosomal replication initiator protein
LLAGLAAQLARSPQGISVRTVAAGDLAGAREDDLTDTRNCDVLALEDVQHLDSRAVAVVCAWIDQRLAGRQATIVTANAGPGRLTGLPYRFTSRLAGGLVVQLQPLSVTSRRGILAEVAKEKNLALAEDALDWLAEQARGGGIRLALGLLQNVAQAAQQYPGPLHRADVERIVASSGLPTLPQPDIRVIVKMVAESFGLSPQHLLGTSRLPAVARSRQVAMYLARELTTLSLPRLGVAFGRDHSTVLHACRKVEQEIRRDAALAQRIRELRSRLQ